MNRKSLGICLIFLLVLAFSIIKAEPSLAQKASKAVGEAFGKPISEEEFNYHYKTALLWTRSGTPDRTDEETRAEAWQNLIFVDEANKIKLSVSDEELKEEIKRLVGEKEVEYGSEKYKAWVPATFGENVKVFEGRIKDLLKVNKLLRLKMDPEVSVTEEEMKEKFLNQYNSFESEYIRFDDEDKAKEFAGQVQNNKRLWKETFDRKKSEEGQKGAAWINVMSLEALIDLWKIPKEDAYRILEHSEGDFVAAKNYYGDVVFRLLSKKRANPDEYDEKKRDYYSKSITSARKYKIAKDYFEELFGRANFRDYIAEARRKAKIEELKKKSTVMLETNKGNIEVKLFPEIAPKAAENFIGLTEKGYFDGLIFHRVIKDFMIQGGDPTGTGTGGESMWGKEFEDEFSDKAVFDKPGVLAMANAGPNTNKSQFFITTKATPWLNNKHTIFGEVVSGYETVKSIEGCDTDPANNKPKEEQKIIKAYVLSGGKKAE